MKLNKNAYSIARARICLTNSEVAEAAKIRLVTLSRAINGGNCYPETAGKIARALGVDVLDIIEQEEHYVGEN